MKRLLNLAAAVSLLSATTAALAFDFTGKPLAEAIEALEARGLTVLYSSDLVKPGMLISQAPSAGTPRAMLEEIVGPHGIRVAEGPAGTLVLMRMPRHAPSVPTEPTIMSAVTEVTVTASRYEWVRIPQPSSTRLSEAELRLAPNVGDDPLRTFVRLPGIAASDFSAKLNVRGGTADEVLVRFDGLRLINPFHLKDFQSIFSAIDPVLVGAVDIYTGGFSASFGDRMSGVIDIHPTRADESPHRELALSLYNGSALAAGRFDHGRGDWALSARRSNLDRVLDWSDMDLGDPTYSDIYAHAGHRIGDATVLSMNLLRFDDDIELADSDVEEQARARYRDRYMWIRVDAHPRESLTGSTIVARIDLESVRSGEAEQPGISRGALQDRREFAVQSLQTDWSWQVSDGAILQFGGEWRHSDGKYRYREAAEFDLMFDLPGALAQSSRTLDLEYRPEGDQYGAYIAVRAEPVPALTFETGIRWDRSTLSGDDGAWSPRASALYQLGDATALRGSWGKFIQTQGIDEAPVSDGTTTFSRAQRADHWLLSLEHRLTEDLDARIEGYYKRYSHLRPRFENLLNKLVILPELKPDRIRLSPPRARATGVELSLRSVRARPLFWWTSYTWAQAEDLFPDRKVRRAWDQRHSFNAGLGWESDRWELSLAGTWHSGWPTTTLELDTSAEDAVVHADPTRRRNLRTHIDIDARIARRFRFQDDSTLTAFFELSNVLNRRNECCIEFEIDAESEEPELVVERMRSLPLLPSLGVVWRF